MTTADGAMQSALALLLSRTVLPSDWEEAARQSHRLCIAEERNQYVFDLFMDAAGAP